MNEWFVSCQKICWNKVNFRKTVNKGELIESTQDQRAVMWSFMPAFSPRIKLQPHFPEPLGRGPEGEIQKAVLGSQGNSRYVAFKRCWSVLVGL